MVRIYVPGAPVREVAWQPGMTVAEACSAAGIVPTNYDVQLAGFPAQLEDTIETEDDAITLATRIKGN